MAVATDFGRVVIIAGASNGFGQSVAIELSRRGGYSLALCARRKGKLDETREMCIQAGISPDKVLCVCADLAKPDNCKMLVDITVKEFGSIYGFVTMVCKHMYPERITEDNIMDRFDKTLAVNVGTPLYLVHLVIPYIEQSKGVVVNISDALAIHPVFDFLTSSINRATIDCMTRALAHNLGHTGVRFYSVSPGVVRTGTLGDIFPKLPEEEYDTVYDAFLPMRALPREPLPEDIGKSIAFLLSDDACFITGVCLPVDGGFSLPYFGQSARLTGPDN